MSVSERRFRHGVDRVFRALIDPEGYPRWLVGAKRIREVDPSWPQPGSEFHHVAGFGPITIADRTTVLELEAPRLLVLRVRARPAIAATVRFELTPSSTGCLLTMTETPVGPYRCIAPLLAPLIQMRNARSLQRLADLVDGAERSATPPS